MSGLDAYYDWLLTTQYLLNICNECNSNKLHYDYSMRGAYCKDCGAIIYEYRSEQR